MGNPYNNTRTLFLTVAKRALEPLAGFGRKLPWGGFGHFLLMLMGGFTQKTELLAIATAPAANQQVNHQAETLRQR